MLILHTWPTPNGKKVPILLEELGVPYKIKFVDIFARDQFMPEFLALSPNNKIPALVDTDAEGGALSLFESGAILTYLADKHGRFLAPSGHARWVAQQWTYWQVGGLGPMMGQAGYFSFYAEEKIPFAIKRFADEVGRLLSVLDRRLAEASFLAGDDYSTADMAAYPWVVGAATRAKEVVGHHLRDKPSVARWMDELAARPAVQRGMASKPAKQGEPAKQDEPDRD